MSFLPPGYEAPKQNSHYLKLDQGDNLIRILGDAIIGWLDWSDENGARKPIRTPYDKKPEPLNPEKPVKHFWAFPVWDYREHIVKIYEITQATIQNAIFDLHNDADWGSPVNYDIGIKKTGEKMETKYSVIAKPPKPLHPDIAKIWADTKIDLNELFRNGDPFNTSTSAPKPPTESSLSSSGDIEQGLSEIFPDEPPSPADLMRQGLDGYGELPV